ncbi:MAG: choice-of-anchor D domain-containing protein, partial [Deltaproteobacteria bacterium]|nr:choice-of-anchor D domain-containing protein [Deltaproteobacteria bacterium]
MSRFGSKAVIAIAILTTAVVVIAAPGTGAIVPAQPRRNISVSPTTGFSVTAGARQLLTLLDPVIAVTPTTLDLGSIDAAQGTGTGTLYVSNVGTGDLTINDVRAVDSGTGAALDWTYVASGPCGGQIPPHCVLAANAQVELAITFDPSRIAVREATLLVSYHDTVDRSMSIPLSGTGTGVTLELVGPAQLDLGRVPLGITSSVTFQLANRGNRVLDDVALEVTPTGPFTVMPAMTTVSHTATRAITLACTPTQLGIAMATVTASAPELPEPLAIMVTCEGTDQALYARPSTIALGEVRTGSAPVNVPIELLSAEAAVTITSSRIT